MKIGFIILPNMLLTSLHHAYELWFAAKQAAQNKTLKTTCKLVLIGMNTQEIQLNSGLSIKAQKVISDDEYYDMLYIPALWRNPRPIVKKYPTLVKWIQRQYQNGAICNATGTGVCFLAQARLLDNKSATTHWYYFEQFAKDYPQIKLQKQKFITSDSLLFCAASINALIDLTLYHIKHTFTPSVSIYLSQHFSYEARLTFQDEDTQHHDTFISQAQIWIQEHYPQSIISLKELAKWVGMSERNLSRRFKLATQMTIPQYTQMIRCHKAKELLQHSRLSIQQVAYKVGYSDNSYFTKKFKQYTQSTPKQFRQKIRKDSI